MRIRLMLAAALLTAFACVATAQTAAPSITIQRAVVPAVYTPGQAIAVTITIQKSDSRDVQAIAVQDTVPGTWTFLSVTATNPSMIPIKGPETANADGTKSLPFYYINIPPFPVTFTYRVMSGTADAGKLTISGLAKFRFTGAEEQSPLVVTTLTATTSSTEGEPATNGGCTTGAGCNQSAKSLGIALGDLFLSALALLTLLALSRQQR